MGIEGTLLSLPTGGFLRSSNSPRFLIDPVLLDAAGQLIGFWAAERLDTGFNVFPFRLEALRIYGPNLPAGVRAGCRARIALAGDTETRSDIDVAGADGRPHVQLLGWQDRRFELPGNFCDMRVSPRAARLARPWPAPIRTLAQAGALVCCLLDTLPGSLLEAHDRIWQRVLAHLVLSRGERTRWRELSGTQRRRAEWLLGRAAAKDAVRLFLAGHYGLELCPADVEILQDPNGRPLAGGSWTGRVEAVPLVSLTHAGGIAAALAGDPASCAGVGIDIERLDRQRNDLEGVAFTGEEAELLSRLGDRQEWALRLWCAKESAAKAIGLGLMGRPTALVVTTADPETGAVQLTVSGELAAHGPRRVDAATLRERDLIVATAALPREG